MRFVTVTVLMAIIGCTYAAPEPTEDGKYHPEYNSGRYIPSDEGKYVHRDVPYVHTDDYRDLGKYHHIHIPYDGGYGPYSGSNIPYRHDDTGAYSQKYQPTTTTTERPRVRYLDEGKWRIIRQEEEKRAHKYDYLYLTENGIYAEEQAKLRDESHRATGTNSKGYYEYPGDDGKIYMVHYTVGEQGFVPMGDHIPTTPPVPHAIQRALDYVAAKKGSTISKRF